MNDEQEISLPLVSRWGVSLRTYQDVEQWRRRQDDAILIGLLRDLLSCEVALDVGH